MRTRLIIPAYSLTITCCVLVLLTLYWISLYSYLLFHSLAEAFSIVIACGVFMLAWNARRFLDNGYLLFMGIAYLFVGGLDLLHTLAYDGMGVFPGSTANLPTQFWIATRYIESLSFLVAPLFLGRKLRVVPVFVSYAAVALLLLGSLFYWRIFPTCYIEGSGLTLFKRVSEYAISVILLVSIGLLYHKRAALDKHVLHLLMWSTLVTILSELCFTFYSDVYDLSNLVGHALKAISFCLIYRAIIETGLIQPYNLIFRDLKAREEALRKSEVNHQALLNAIPDTMFRISRDGILLDFQVGRGEGLNLPPDRLEHKQVMNAFPEECGQQIITHATLALQTGEPQSFEFQMAPSPDARLHDYEARLVISDEDEVLVIMRDISSRKAADRMKNDFVSTVSHELRTPLTSIRGSLGLIAGGVVGEISGQARAMLDIALKNCERLGSLINDILDTEKIKSGKMDFDWEVLDLSGLVAQAVEANQAYGHSLNVRFVLRDEVTDAMVKVDANRLMQVLANLLSNAAKYSPPGEVVAVSVVRRNGMLRVAVTDHGPGIPHEFHARVFSRFTQLDTVNSRQSGGTGLGLNICKAIIEALGGQINFETVIGVGTTFHFDLPEWNEANH